MDRLEIQNYSLEQSPNVLVERIEQGGDEQLIFGVSTASNEYDSPEESRGCLKTLVWVFLSQNWQIWVKAL
jgi:hypothetical protein